MLSNKSFYCLLLFSWLSIQPTYGQSLLKDIHALMRANTVLDSLASDRSKNNDSLKVQYSAEVLAILHHYNQTADTYLEDPHNKAPEIVAAYTDNPDSSALVKPALLSLDSFAPYFNVIFRQKQNELLSGKREKISQILTADFALAPKEYLSVSRIIQEYNEPPLPTLSVINQTAASSNNNVRKGIVNEAAIIMGLFNFLLDRGQEEVVIGYLERMLGEKGISGLNELFPTTTEAYADKQFTYSENFLNRLRDAFYQDLQQLSITMPQLLSNPEYFDLLDSDPLAFNFLQIYTMIGMAQQGMTLSEIIPVTYRSLYERYRDEEKAFNLKMAEAIFTLEEYKTLASTSEQILSQLLLINRKLQDQQAIIDDELNELFFSDADFELETEPGSTSTQDSVRPLSLDDLPVFGEPYQDLEILLQGGKDKGYSLDLLPGMLVGQLDPEIVKSWSTLATYDRFLRNPMPKKQLQAAGLELTRQLSGRWYHKQSLPDLLYTWHKDLLYYRAQKDKLRAKKFPTQALRENNQKFIRAQTAFVTAINQTLLNWRGPLNQNDSLNLLVLKNVVTDAFVPGVFPRQDPNDRLLLQWEELKAAQQRLGELNDQFISSGFPKDANGSTPIEAYFETQKTIDTLQNITFDIQTLEQILERLTTQLDQLDQKVLREEYEALKNISPLVQLTEVLSHLIYFFQTDTKDDQWLARTKVDSMLFNNQLRPVFLGLLNQRLNQTHLAGSFAPKGLITFVRSTVGDLNLLSAPPTDPADSLAFFRKATFAGKTLNRLLELPILTDPKTPDQPISLVQQYPLLAPIPKLSDQTLDFVYYLNLKDHRHAMSSLIRLLTGLSNAILANNPSPKPSIISKKEQKDNPPPENGLQRQKQALDFLNTYGPFVADLIDADSGRQVQSLLNGVSDPPGSSRVKRRERFTVNLNGYVGLLTGNERLTGSALSQDESYLTVAPTMPIGLSFSSLIGNGDNPKSFSLFLSILDLGSLTTYQLDADVAGDNQLTFKNILKPGAQLHWNLKKSPFYLGAGAQFGPQFREFNGEQKQVNAFRTFISFGVDVVIKRLY